MKLFTQTAGRAARNIDGLVILYADKITDAINHLVETTNKEERSRKFQQNTKLYQRLFLNLDQIFIQHLLQVQIM